jgi:tetratricopeptide (TPR) repeat protein
MSRVTSLTSMPEAQLNRWIKRIGLLLLVGVVAFIAFYAVDRFRAPVAPIVDQKLAALEEAVRKDPADAVSRGQLADVYYAKRRFEEAIIQYTSLIDAKKDVELASLGRANSYRQLERWDESIKDYNRVIEIGLTGEMANVDPSLEAAYYGLGVIALAQGKPGDAIEPLTKAIAIIRTDADALNALGAAYIGTNLPEQALKPLRSAIALVPVGWAEPYSNLSAAYTKLGKPDLAAWANAMALLESGDPAGAEAELLKLVSGEAANEATVSLGLLKEVQGDTGAAGEWYRKALVLDPGNIPAQMGLKRVSGGDRPASAVPSASPTAGSN